MGVNRLMNPCLQDKPNMLIIVVDSVRADHVACHGYDRDTTPNIDRLADEGCLFETAISAAPFSPASYASIFSNLYPHQHGVNGDTVRVWPDGWQRLPERLQACGYHTFCISNNAFVTRAMNCARGFDTFVDMREPSWYVRRHNSVFRRVRRHLGERWAKRLSSNHMHCIVKGDSGETVRRAAALIDGTDKPFFGFIILMDPHTPYNKLRTHYSGCTPDVRRFFARRNQRTMYAELMAECSGLSASELAVVRDLYDAEIRHSDACVGTLVDWLRETGRLHSTLVAVTSDHGEGFGEHGVWGHGFCLNDCLTRVPLVVRHPWYWSPGTRCRGLVQLHDLHDLCLSVASTGVPQPERYPNCLTQAADPDWGAREVVFSEFPRQSKTLRFMRERNPCLDPGVWDRDMWAARSADWRYVEYDDGECELYDLRRDPDETTSVHNYRPEVCDELRSKLNAHKDARPYEAGEDTAPQEVEEVVVERLRALGYVE